MNINTIRRSSENIGKENIPSTESLKDTIQRMVPHWQKVIVPSILSQETVLMVAHGNTIRALVKHLDKISEKDISKLNIPTGVPLVYEVDTNVKPIRSYYLGIDK